MVTNHTSFDAIVIGAGIMGASTAWALAKRGQRVLCLDRHGIPNTLGSSHGHSRITRMAYFEHPDYVPLLRRSNDLWRELEELSGSQLLLKTGGLYLGPEDCPLITGSLESAKLHGLDHEILSQQEVAGRFPQFSLPEGNIGFYEADGGVLFPERCLAALIDAAARRNVEFRGHERAMSWRSFRGKVNVRTTLAEYHADRLVLCAGPWAAQEVRDLGVPLKVTRQVAAWYWPQNPESFAPEVFPICAMQDSRGSFAYAFPMFSDRPGLKAASHDLGEVVSPDAPRSEPTQSDTEPFEATLRAFLPDAHGPLLSLSACLYTNSPDGHFILDRHSEYPNVAFGCGFSGHGFKFATVVGEALAKLVSEEVKPSSIGFLSLSRFNIPK